MNTRGPQQRHRPGHRLLGIRQPHPRPDPQVDALDPGVGHRGAQVVAAGLFDGHARLLAQVRSVPAFLGTLGMAIESVVAAVGGEETLRPGDVLLSTQAYDTGSHVPDVTIVVPGFVEAKLIGYAAVKAHVTDLGVKDAAAADTTDIFQEGLILPGVRLHRAGELQEDVYRILLANSRAPEALAGDIAAIMAAARMGLDEL